MEKECTIINALLKGTPFHLAPSNMFKGEVEVFCNRIWWGVVSRQWLWKAHAKSQEEILEMLKQYNLYFNAE